MSYCFNYKVEFTIQEGRFAGWLHEVDIEFMTTDEIIQELSVQMHQGGLLQQVQHDDGTDDYHDVEVDEDVVDDLFTVTGGSDWKELGYDVNAGLSDLLGYRDDVVRVLAGDGDKDEIIGIWKAAVRLSGPEYVDCDALRDNHIGRFNSMKDFAIKHVGELSELLPIVRDNINWEGIVADLESDYSYDEESGHLFIA